MMFMALASPTMGLPEITGLDGFWMFLVHHIDASASIKAPPGTMALEVFIMPSLALERSH